MTVVFPHVLKFPGLLVCRSLAERMPVANADFFFGLTAYHDVVMARVHRHHHDEQESQDHPMIPT